MNTSILGDIRTSQQRMYKYQKKERLISKTIGTVILLLIALAFLSVLANKMVDLQIKSKMAYNLRVYHDVNGFQPVR